MSKTPIFISGIGRSGTSAVIKSVAEHQSVVKPERIGEAPFVAHFINFLMDYEDNSPAKDYNLRNYQLDAAGRASEFSSLLSSMQYGCDINQPDVEGEHWIAKVSLSPEAYKKAANIFESVRTIYVMRNGVEVVNSAKSFEGFADLTFKQLCTRWADNINQCRYVFDTKHCSVIKHHELVQDPHSVYERVFKELELPHDNGPADFIQTNLFNSSFDKTSQLKSTANVFQERLKCWFEWSDEEKAVFIETCDDLMREFDFVRPYENDAAIEITEKAVSADVHTFPTGVSGGSDESRAIDKATLRKINTLYREIPQYMPVPEFNYFANPSIKNGYFFMENPKVASTSILKGLHQHELPTGVEPAGGPHDRDKSPIARMSTLDKATRAEMLFSDDVFRYTFVRNPYSRLLSAYLSKISKSLRSKAEILAVMTGVDKDEITDLSQEVSFEEFVDVVVSQESLEMNPHWRQQCDQVLYDIIDYDFFARFECLNEDYLTVCERTFGVEESNLSQSKNKTSSNTTITDYYTDDIAKKVFAKFERDFDVFNYSSDLQSALLPPMSTVVPLAKVV